MINNYAVINGDLVLKADAKILIADLSIQRGYGIFDFFITVDNQPRFLDDHLDRFFGSASAMHLNNGINREQIKKWIQQLIKKNNLPGSGIRITLTGGYSEDGYTLSTPNLLITQSAFTFNKEIFYKGTGLVTYDYQRQLPQVKTIDYLQAIYLQPFIKTQHADDVLYYHQGEINECPRSNFFIVTAANEIVTPAKNILKGITRKRILELPGFNSRESVITRQQLQTIKEAFITSTTKIVLPVLKIDGKIIGDGKPGKTTTEIYHQLTERN